MSWASSTITWVYFLEKKRFSITRLKLVSSVLRLLRSCGILKRKDSRLRDWNCAFKERVRLPCWSWKEKILDYEIETVLLGWSVRCCSFLKRKDSRLRDWNWYGFVVLHLCGAVSLEKKRFSITRLKPVDWSMKACSPSLLKRKDSRLRDWNSICLAQLVWREPSWKEKILDYEIETVKDAAIRSANLFAWKEKILDYEIETGNAQGRVECSFVPWKEKILDYEIETVRNVMTRSTARLLKRKDSRLRDWNPIAGQRK